MAKSGQKSKAQDPGSRVENAIEHGEHVAHKFLAAAGLSIVIATGLITEAATLRDTYAKDFGTKPQAVLVQEEHHSGEPPKPKEPSGDGDPPQPTSEASQSNPKAVKPVVSVAGRNYYGETPKNPKPQFFESVWALHEQPSLSMSAKTGEKTMLDFWLTKEAQNFEVIERATRDAPTLVDSLNPKERQALVNILDVYRSHQANAQEQKERAPVTNIVKTLDTPDK